MSTPVEKIKERLNIVDLLGTYIKLEKAGKNMKARCPFHNEKTPSFFVSPDRDSYYCFGCGAKGDIFTFVQEFEGLDFFGALKLLAERTGVTLERTGFEKKDDKEAIFNALEAATQFFESNLPKSQSAQKYLEKRGLTEKTIKDWRIGFVADDWRTLYDYLAARKFSDNEIEQAGLIKRNERSFYDRFRGRIMFPIRDSAGRVVGFTGRILPEADDGKAAKYLNSPETAVFNKSRILYGFDLAKLAIKKFDYTVIVEGQMDIIMCHQAGFQNVVATSGTALTPEHLTLLRRISNRVIMAFDADKAGVNAATKAWQLALSLGMEVKIAEFKEGKDPADVILSDGGKEKFKEALKDSMHIIDFYLSKIIAEKLEPRKMGVEVREKILPFLVLIESSIEKSHFVKKISDKCGIAEAAIWEDLKKVKVEPGVSGVETKISNFNDTVQLGRLDSIERRVLGVINWQEKDLSAQAGAEKIIDINKSKARVKEIIGEYNFKKWQETPEQILNEATFEAEQYYDKKKIQMVLDELLMELEKEYIKKDLALAMSEMIKAEKEKDLKKRDIMANKCNELTKRLAKLK
jgi:DNA primase